MQVNTVWIAYEMHHQNERIMQMQLATLQSLYFLSLWGVCSLLHAPHKDTNGGDAGLHRTEQSFKSNFWHLNLEFHLPLYCLPIHQFCVFIQTFFHVIFITRIIWGPLLILSSFPFLYLSLCHSVVQYICFSHQNVLYLEVPQKSKLKIKIMRLICQRSWCYLFVNVNAIYLWNYGA